MSPKNVQDLALLLGLWLGFIGGYWIGRVTGAKKPNRWELFRTWIGQSTPRPQRLCGYHTASEMRPGLSSVVDSKNCEECAADEAWLARTNKKMIDRTDHDPDGAA